MIDEQAYSSADVQQILTIALGRESSSPAQLKEMAEELAVDDATLRYAVEAWQVQKLNAQKKQRQRQAFYRYELFPYLVVNAFLVGLNIAIAGSITWSIYPVLCWGASLLLEQVTGWAPSYCLSRKQSYKQLRGDEELA